jgi:DNA-binding PadR family transcriptional regulator
MTDDVRVTLQVLKLLEALVESEARDRYGFELLKVTGLKSGTLYPILARLESAGWLSSGWESAETAGRPRRRYYRLTGVGATAAHRHLANAPGRSLHSQPRTRPVAGPAFGMSM